MNKHLQYDILIIGGGPTGLVLANLLGPSGLRVAVIEKQTEVYPVPRATHIDEETLRNFHLTGLMPELQNFITPFGKIEILDNNGKILYGDEVIQPSVEHGYAGSHFFDQPAFEKILRKGLNRYANVDFIVGDFTDITQTTTIVTADVNIKGGQKEISSHWAVACDGGRSAVRQALNIEMDSLEPAREWVIVDALLKNEKDSNLLPDGFRYMLQKERLCINAHGFGLNRRWEFQLNPGEQMPLEEIIKIWLSRYVRLDKIQITRIAKYAHNSLVAKKWRADRIFLAGDAAHMMPPSAGQGLCSGVRDAVNLAWKLEQVCKGTAADKLLDSYEQERKEHLLLILKRTLFINTRLNADGLLSRIRRNVELRIIESIEPLKAFLKAKYDTVVAFTQGYLSGNTPLAGKHLPQFNACDAIVGYKPVVITVPALLSTEQKNTLLQQGYLTWENPAYAKWIEENNLDYVMVRPDKIVFDAGKREQLEKIFTNSKAQEESTTSAVGLALTS
jgi:3-(3-hydroxy-phenyl)propionate hydroxylase